jgi:lipoprotein-releasing system permease protein
MSFELNIARKYLTQKKETGFITLIMYISMTGLTIGVAALIITLGILNGFENAIKEKIIQFQAHVRLETYSREDFQYTNDVFNRLYKYEEVKALSPFIEKMCMLRAGNMTDGLVVRGIDPALVGEVLTVEPLIVDGKMDFTVDDDGYAGIMVGLDIAERFVIKLGDIVLLASPSGMRSGLLSSPSRRQYKVTGIFESGMSEYDNLFCFIDLEEAQSFFKIPDHISGIDILLNDVENSTSFARKATTDLQSWLDLNITLFDWMAVQRFPVLIAFGMIILVGSINLISTLILIVIEKQKDIGILKSMGANSKTILLIFLAIGFITGITATAAGSVLALILGWIQNSYQVFSLNKDVYYINTLPVELNWPVFFQIGFFAVVLCIAATLFPAWKASRLMPSEALRRN